MARKSDIRLRRSAVATAVPGSADLNLGELALNTADGALFIKNGADNIVTVSHDGILHYDEPNSRIGIGTTQPDKPLHVNGGTIDYVARFQSSDTSAGIELKDSTSTAAIRTQNGHIVYIADTENAVGASSHRWNIDNLSTGEKMRLTSSGELGIGTDLPNRKLHISGFGSTVAVKVEATDSVQSSLDLKNSEGEFRLINDGGSLSIYDQTDTTERFRINTSGNIGIGTSAPATKLHVANGSDTSDAVRISGGHASRYLAIRTFENNSLVGAGISLNASSSGGAFKFQTTSSTKMTIANDGKVGIGTDTPDYSLDIESSTASMRVRKTANDATVIIESSTAGAWTTYKSPNYYAGALYNINGVEEWAVGLLQGVDRWTVRKGRSGTEFFTITNTGNIGINTGSPDAKFQIEHNGGHTSGSVTISHSMFDLYNPLEANTDEKGSILTFSDNYFDSTNYIRTTRAAIKGGTDTVGNTADGFLAFYTDSGGANSLTERMRITKDGRVGIGTNNPIQALQAVGSIYANGGNVFVDSGQKFIWGNSQQWIQASNSASMFFATNGQNRLELQTDGDLILSGDIHMATNHIDFNINGSSTVPQLIGDRSATNLDSRNFSTEGGFSYTTFESTAGNKPSHSSNNANGVITLNTHSGSYNHQLAFTNKGNIAQRSRDGGGYTSWYNILTDRAPNSPSITSTTTVNETVEIVFAASTSGDHVAATSYEVWSDGGTGSDYSLIAKIPYNDIASSMSVVDASFDDSGTIAYRVYAIKNGVYSTASTTTHSFSMPSLDVSNMSVVADTTNYYVQYDMPDTRFLDHVEIYMDAEASSGNLTRTGASLVYSGTSDSYMYNISSSDMEKYHQFWVEVVTV